MCQKLFIIGASGHGKVVADAAEKMKRYQEIFFLDDAEIKECNGYPVIGDVKAADRYINDGDFFVAIGNASVRQKIQEHLIDKQAAIATIVHPTAVIGKNVTIGKGSVLMAGTILNSGCHIGQGCIINTGASIDHDCLASDYVHVSVGAHLAGTVTVGERTWVGIGAIVSNNLQITHDCMIGAGAVIVHSIDKSGTYVGVPAKEISMEMKILEGGVILQTSEKCNAALSAFAA